MIRYDRITANGGTFHGAAPAPGSALPTDMTGHIRLFTDQFCNRFLRGDDSTPNIPPAKVSHISRRSAAHCPAPVTCCPLIKVRVFPDHNQLQSNSADIRQIVFVNALFTIWVGNRT